jgi:predicted TIM-barrel fold metal-dependent hydrolase
MGIGYIASPVMRLDVHQHLWSEPLVAALARRRHPPRVRRGPEGWWLDLAGEPPCRLDVDDPGRRAELVRADGLDRALIGLSSPLGIEFLAPGEAEPILDAYHAGVAELPPVFGGWASIALRDLGAGAPELQTRLDQGFHGLCLPTGALGTPGAVDRLGPVLDVLERRDAPLFVHPGPVPAAGDPVPAWWPALTGYVEGLHAAWHAFAAVGRTAHPRLRVVFAALAGGAPLHLERVAARGGPIASAFDSGVYYETSSYGPRMIDAMLRVVGVDRLVYGSDRPVVEPHAPHALGPATWAAMAEINPTRLLAAAA